MPKHCVPITDEDGNVIARAQIAGPVTPEDEAALREVIAAAKRRFESEHGEQSDTPAPAHTCHARGCDTRIQPHMFMCRPHWRMLPFSLRHSIWATYRPGQERDKRPSREYLDVTAEAIEVVAAKEAARG